MTTSGKIVPIKIDDPHLNDLIKSLKSAAEQRGRSSKFQHFARLCLKPESKTVAAVWDRVYFELAEEVRVPISVLLCVGVHGTPSCSVCINVRLRVTLSRSL